MSQPASFLLPRPDGDLPVLRWSPAAGEQGAGGIVLAHEIFGAGSYIRSRAADLARAGFVVDVPVLFFRESSQAVPADAPDLLERGMALAAATDWDTAVGDLCATAEHLSLDTAGPVTLLGFCYGGGLAYASTAADAASGAGAVSALVSYYGSALPTLTHLEVDVPSLHHFGTADAYIPLDQARAIEEHVRAVRSPVEFDYYEGAGHAFDNPLPLFHHPEASAAAWERTLAFLHRAGTA